MEEVLKQILRNAELGVLEAWDEAKTKQYIIEPVLSRFLNWDVHDPATVVTEFIADVPSRKGEKVDYALKYKGNTPIIIEAKRIRDDITSDSVQQLARYYPHCVEDGVKVAILTNGLQWQFYGDFNKDNIMDREPFLTINLADFETYYNILQSLNYETFNIDTFKNFGKTLLIKDNFTSVLKDEAEDPGDDLVRLLIQRYNDKMGEEIPRNHNTIAIFKGLLQDFINSFKIDENESTVLVEPMDNTPIIMSTKKVKRRLGYFISSEGIEGSRGSLRASWNSFWLKVAENPAYLDKMYELSKNGKLGFSSESKSYFNKEGVQMGFMNSKIRDDLFITDVLGSDLRLQRLKRISEFLGFTSDVVYIDGL